MSCPEAAGCTRSVFNFPLDLLLYVQLSIT